MYKHIVGGENSFSFLLKTDEKTSIIFFLYFLYALLLSLNGLDNDIETCNMYKTRLFQSNQLFLGDFYFESLTFYFVFNTLSH